MTDKLPDDRDSSPTLLRDATIDHLVINCADVSASAAWYNQALGATVEIYDGALTALVIGSTYVRLRPTGSLNWLAAHNDAPGAFDLCVLTETPVQSIVAQWASLGIETIRGPIHQSGARGRIVSVYTRDPDGNLVEVANSVSG